MSSLNDISNLFGAIKAVQEDFTCKNCKQLYKRKWCKDEKTACYFCKNFLPMRDTYESILRDHDWHFIKSGESDRELFYPDFLDNLRIWADHFHVLPTKQDQALERELRGTF